MPTPAERKALIFLSLVATLGASVRVIGAPAGTGATDSSARRALREQMNAVEAARRNARTAPGPRGSKSGRSSTSSTATAVSTPAARPRGPIDLDKAGAEELETLPGIGPALAGRIVADRNMYGPFGSLLELQRVKGIGPAVSKRLTPHVTFSGTPRPSSADLGGRSRANGARGSAGSPGGAAGAPRRVGRMSIPP